MGNIIKKLFNNKAGDIPFRKCYNYNVPIGRSRLSKCTCIDNDISLTGKCECFHKEVGNDGIGLTTSINSRAGCSDDINFVTLSTAHAEQSYSHEANEDREAQNETINTYAELGFAEYSKKSGLNHIQTADHMLDTLENESTKTPTSLMISNDFLTKVSSKGNCSKDPEFIDELENSPSRDTHESRELRIQRVSHVDRLSARNIFKDLVDDIPSVRYKISPEVALQGQRHGTTQHKLLSDDVRGMGSTPTTSSKRRVVKKITTEASNQMLVPKKNIRISGPKASLKGRAKRKRTSVKASNEISAPKVNIRISVPSDVIYVEIEKEPSSPLVEQSSRDKVLQSIHMSRMIQTPVSYVHQSPHTRSKPKSVSISTPESLRRSRSGRLIVPRLDPGNQNIIYGPDGIVGITNLELHVSQGCNSEPPSKGRKRSRHLPPNHNRLLTL